MSAPDGSRGQSQYGPAAAPAQNRVGPDPAKLLGLAVAGLGGLNFIWGFLPELTAPRINEDLSVFAVGPGYVPILLLIAGLLALAALLPGSERSRLAVAAVSVGGAAGAIVSLGTTGPVELLATGQVSKGLGATLLVIFGIIQAVVAIAGYVVGADFSQRAAGGAGPNGVSNPAAAVQPGWFDPSAGAMPARYPAPLGAPAGSVQPGVPQPQPWWPDPSEAPTGPQVVIGPELLRRDGDTDSAGGGVPGRQP